MNMKPHWEAVYRRTAASRLSWFQGEARVSLDLITRRGHPSDAVIDVGGGASPLVDGLLARGYTDLTVLDIAPAALNLTRSRMAALADRVTWLAADVLAHPFPRSRYDVWHDRAVFHFLTSAEDRRAYVDQVARAVRPGGWVIVATFSEDGPSRCSGLDVCRYSSETLHAEFGSRFDLLAGTSEDHVTPDGSVQHFQYCVCSVNKGTVEAGPREHGHPLGSRS
jgi:ubiquinone/menaquinone biosynthesis C-methylase UbiE